MAEKNYTLTQERLKELLNYDPITGLFTWRVNRGFNKTMGKQAGRIDSKGYTSISIDNRSFYGHSLAWLYIHGVLPIVREIIRINDDNSDNRIANLAWHVKSEDREVTVDRVKSELCYSPETGIFRWIIAPVNTIKAGDIAGSIDNEGYSRIKLGKTTHSSHRLAWFVTYGNWPIGEIDHINGVRDDNRISNLRDVTKSENLQNQRVAQSGAKSGYLGVSFNHGKWRAAIQVDKKTISLGNFFTPELAHAAYIEAKRRLHSTCTI